MFGPCEKNDSVYAPRTMFDLSQSGEDVARLCRFHGIARLELFGSGASEGFDPASSDLDFIAEFANKQPGTYADRYLDFAVALEKLFGRDVDLLTVENIRSPLFRQAVEASKVVVYDQSSDQKAA